VQNETVSQFTPSSSCELRHLRSVLHDLISRQNQLSLDMSRKQPASESQHVLQQLQSHVQQQVLLVKARICALEVVPDDCSDDALRCGRQFSPGCEQRDAKAICADFARRV
jgi:hypothetical protein